jgi:hypothetical protein
MEYLDQSREAFDRDVSLGTTNEADLAGHYPYSPERFRVFVNGTRQFIQYDGEPPEYEDIVDGHLLKPQTSGDVVTFQTSERYRYVVQYVIEWSFSTQLNQELQAGDVYACGYGDPDLENSTDDTPGPNADGWFVYQNSSHGPKEATLAEYRSGTEKDATTIQFRKLFQTFGRLAGETNWYNVGNTRLTETSTGDYDGVANSQRNEKVGRVSVDDGKGPEIANKSITFSLKAGSGAGSLHAEVGSIGLRTLGQVTGILRTKTFDFALAYEGTTTEFEPLLAIRVDPDRFQVNTQFNVLEPLEFDGNDDIVLIAQIFDKQNVLDANGDPLVDADYTTPDELSATNSVIQTSNAVDQVPDGTGTPQTSMTNPGGYQVAYGSLTSAGSGGSAQRVTSRARTQKRALPNGDVAVLMARSPSTGTINGDLQFEQDW